MLFKHPHIVQAITVRDFEGRFFLVLEYIEPDSDGRNTLSNYIVRHGRQAYTVDSNAPMPFRRNRSDGHRQSGQRLLFP